MPQSPAFAEKDEPAILAEWHELRLEAGTRTTELLLAERPEYVLFGGSGTLTPASPELARKHALPAITRWSAMARAAGVYDRKRGRLTCVTHRGDGAGANH